MTYSSERLIQIQLYHQIWRNILNYLAKKGKLQVLFSQYYFFNIDALVYFYGAIRMINISSSISFAFRRLMAAAPEMTPLLRFSAETIRYESWRPNSQVSSTQYRKKERDWKRGINMKGHRDKILRCRLFFLHSSYLATLTWSYLFQSVFGYL